MLNKIIDRTFYFNRSHASGKEFIEHEKNVEKTENQKESLADDITKKEHLLQLRNKDADIIEEKVKSVREELAKIPETKPGPERLLDPDYELEQLKDGSYRKELLKEFKVYYDQVQRNLQRDPKPLSKEERQLAKKIEGLPLTNNDKISLILVWRRLKPGTNLQLDIDNTGRLSRWRLERKARIIRSVLNKLGMYVDEKDTQTDSVEERTGKRCSSLTKVMEVTPNKAIFNVKRGENQRFYDYYEAKKKGSKIVFDRDIEKTGMFFGYPPTAIAAVEKMLYYPEKKHTEESPVMDRSQLPELLRKLPSYFVYSKSNWKEESKTTIRWVREIDNVSPSLYNEEIGKNL